MDSSRGVDGVNRSVSESSQALHLAVGEKAERDRSISANEKIESCSSCATSCLADTSLGLANGPPLPSLQMVLRPIFAGSRGSEIPMRLDQNGLPNYLLGSKREIATNKNDSCL